MNFVGIFWKILENVCFYIILVMGCWSSGIYIFILVNYLLRVVLINWDWGVGRGIIF